MSRICLFIWMLMIAAWGASAVAQPSPAPWDMQSLSRPPRSYPAPDLQADGVQAVFYDALPWKDKPTRAFAFYGLPANVKPDQKVPAMVLVHGGGGSAFAEWVRLWTARGYAAIAMDTCGSIPKGQYGNWQRHEHGGPPGWGGFDQIDQPIHDQWTYHAVADVILAHSLIRSLPQVDPERTGITGISWGGYLTCIAASVDSRYKLAVPVYGCGFLGDNSTWLGQFQKMGAEQSGQWRKLWDPSVYLKSAKMPLLWVTGTNDFAYPLDSLQKSYRLPPGARTLCIRIRMPHGHGGAGENPEEIHAFANAILKSGEALGAIGSQSRDGRRASITFTSGIPMAKAELVFTQDQGQWQDRKWQSLAADLDSAAGRVSADLPRGTTVYYFNLTDQRNQIVSSEHEEGGG